MTKYHNTCRSLYFYYFSVDVSSWKVSGDWFDVCKCNIPCPCEFAQTPTYGECDGILAYHINKGNYGEATLDGLKLLS